MGEIGLLLKELVNGPDPRNVHGQELGFNSGTVSSAGGGGDERGECAGGGVCVGEGSLTNF